MAAKIRLGVLGVALTVAVVAPVTGAAQQADGPVGTILVAHGGGPAWDAQVVKIAELAQTGGPVEVSFLMGTGAAQHRFQDAAERLEEQGVSRIVVVPVLVSSHGSHFQQIRYLAGETDELSESMRHHLEMAGIERAEVDVPITLSRAVDDSPEAAAVLAARALELAEEPSEQAVFLLGHGPNASEDHAQWMANLRPVAERVKASAGFRSVLVGLVRDDAAPPVRAEAVAAVRETIQLQHEATGRPVVVVPVLISTGRLSREKLPVDLEGLPVIYSGDALLPHPGMARWVEARVREGSVLTPAAAKAAGPSDAATAPAHHH